MTLIADGGRTRMMILQFFDKNIIQVKCDCGEEQLVEIILDKDKKIEENANDV